MKVLKIILILAVLASLLVAPVLPVQADITDGEPDLATNSPVAVTTGFYAQLTASKKFYGIAEDVTTYSYDPTTNAWLPLGSLPAGINQWLYMTESNTVTGKAYIIGYTGSAVRVYRWDYLAGSATNYTTTGLTGSNRLIFADEVNNKIHVLSDLGATTHDWTHSISVTSGAWTDNGHIAGVTAASYSYLFDSFYSAPDWYFMCHGTAANSFKFDVTTQTFSQLTETDKNTMPAGGVASIYKSGTYVYGLCAGNGIPLKDSTTSEVWRYSIATGTWVLFSDDFVFGENVRGDTTFRDVMGFKATNNVMYFVSSRATTYKTIKTLRVFGFASAQRGPVFPPNDALGVPTTTGVMTSVTWDVPRATFNDELQGFQWAGTANLIFTPQIVDSNGTVIIGPVTLQIANDGFWDWGSISLPADFTGFFKAVDTTSGLSSTWGYATYARISGFEDTKTYAKYLDSVTLRNPSEYTIGPSGLGIWAWKTDISDLEMVDYTFRIMQSSDTSDNTYTCLMSDLIDDYFEVGYASNEGLVAVRYILTMFNKPASQNDYDGLIINLSRNYQTTPGYEGFYEPAVVDSATGTTRFTTTQSVYFYTQNTNPFSITLNKQNYNPSATFTGAIQVYSTALYYPFDTLEWQVLTATQGLYAGPFTITDRLLSVLVAGIMPATQASFYADAYLSNSGDSGIFVIHSYYGFTVSGKPSGGGGAGTTDPVDAIHGWLDGFGLDNMVGTWGLTMLAMVIVFLIFYLAGAKLLATVMALLVLGLAILSGFVDMWLVLLLAVGAGIGIYKWFTRNKGTAEG